MSVGDDTEDPAVWNADLRITSGNLEIQNRPACVRILVNEDLYRFSFRPHPGMKLQCKSVGLFSIQIVDSDLPDLSFLIAGFKIQRLFLVV